MRHAPVVSCLIFKQCKSLILKGLFRSGLYDRRSGPAGWVRRRRLLDRAVGLVTLKETTTLGAGGYADRNPRARARAHPDTTRPAEAGRGGGVSRRSDQGDDERGGIEPNQRPCKGERRCALVHHTVPRMNGYTATVAAAPIRMQESTQQSTPWRRSRYSAKCSAVSCAA